MSQDTRRKNQGEITKKIWYKIDVRSPRPLGAGSAPHFLYLKTFTRDRFLIIITSTVCFIEVPILSAMTASILGMLSLREDTSIIIPPGFLKIWLNPFYLHTGKPSTTRTGDHPAGISKLLLAISYSYHKKHREKKACTVS